MSGILRSLRFADPAAEAAFVARENETVFQRTRVACLVGLVSIAGFAVLDPHVVGDANRLLIGRGIIIACFAVLILFNHRPPLRDLQPLPMCAMVLIVGSACAIAPAAANAPFWYATGGLMLTALALSGLLGVRTIASLITGSLLLLATVLAAVTADDPAVERVIGVILVAGALVFGILGSYFVETILRRNFAIELALAQERARADTLLRNVLPSPIVDRLTEDSSTIADRLDEVTVVFADIMGSTELAERLPPDELVALLDELFSTFDAICREHGVEKIKTIGDAYMAVAGAPRPNSDHAVAGAQVALGWKAAARQFSRWPGGLRLRIGIHSGPVVAGVIGRDKFAYDLWGDTVNTASRMESHGVPGEIHVSEATRTLLAGRYAFSDPISTAVKGKGPMTTYLLLRPAANV